ncbi:MAG TPA: hypothetical protein VHN14_29930 [Kofleriaceae bacterium]|jgi:hypothetical protein|nr:hypothetical protein [Kofleriaceae bacterium]
MRLASLALIASLVAGPGCVFYATPPLVGAAGGVVVASARNFGGDHHSYTKHALVGTVLGLALDAVMIALLLRDLNHPWGIED